MLKLLVGILLLLNLLLFATSRGLFDVLLLGGHEPQRLQQQLHPEKIRLLPAAVLNPPRSADSAQREQDPSATMCVELGDFTEADAGRFEAQLRSLNLDQKLSRRTINDASSFMVFIPSQGDKGGAERKANELRQLDVTDFYILQGEGEQRFGISLGVFKSRAAAEAQLAALNKKGVRSARITGRSTGATKVALQLRSLNAAGVLSATDLAGKFSNIDQRECIDS